jgi:dipeptidyl aminopeptidase/acylaminoacyl peptidase
MKDILTRRPRGFARAALVVAMALAALAALLPLRATAATPEAGVAAQAAAYARWPSVSDIVLSPSGAHAAMLARLANGRTGLAVLDLAKGGEPKILAGYDDVDVGGAQWISDRRIVYAVYPVWEHIGYDKSGTFAVDIDGGHERQLISGRSGMEAATGSSIRSRVLPRNWRVWDHYGGEDQVLVARYFDSDAQGYRARGLSVLDTRTLVVKSLTTGNEPEGTDGWWLDRAGTLRVVTATVGQRRQLWARASADAAWTKLEDHDLYVGGGVEPVVLEADGTLIVRSRVGRDTEALYTYDLAKRRVDPDPLVAVDGYDIAGVRFDRHAGRVVGVNLRTTVPSTVWFDEGPARIQAIVDKALPAGRSNLLLCQRCASAQRVVVWSQSDRQPGEFWLFDAATSKLTLLGETMPWIKEAEQGRRTVHRVAARDGLPLPVVVTHPNGLAADAPAPTIMLVHGGPWAPGADATWSAEPQFLAARGYRVLQVSFRGTTGLGWRHLRSSWGQWGLGMQDDLEDALLWAVENKLTDPARVCIYGSSYGGYAALMGPVRHPQRYRCAVSHVGVTEIRLLYSRNWTDIAQAFRTYGLTRLVGDLADPPDAERIRRTSPIHRVAEIKVPVLVAQGRYDERVAPEHADRFVSAARAAGVDVERVDYEDGHGWYSSASHEDFLKRLDAFFARHLGPR